MSNVTVIVHLDVDVWDHRETEAVRVSRKARSDVYLAQGERATGQWNGRPSETKHLAAGIAARRGLDDAERERGQVVDAAYADDSRDHRWIITFAL